MAPQRTSCNNGLVRRSCWWHGWVALLLVLLLVSLPASAQEHTLRGGGGMGLMTLERPPYQARSMGILASLRYLLNDQFWLLGEVSSTSYSLRRPAPDPCPEPPAPCQESTFPYPVYGLTGAVGAVYTLDVTRVVPYGGLLLGGSQLGAGEGGWGALRGEKAREIRLGMVIALGVEYQVTEQWSVGVGVRLHEYGQPLRVSQLLFQLQWRL
ncbi:MAG: outer membrane beta-barrel protein [Polyangiaceae bacterium]|nr:outer membrane beta-barrel protein [Polyangiaceae bacterium]